MLPKCFCTTPSFYFTTTKELIIHINKCISLFLMNMLLCAVLVPSVWTLYITIALNNTVTAKSDFSMILVYLFLFFFVVFSVFVLFWWFSSDWDASGSVVVVVVVVVLEKGLCVRKLCREVIYVLLCENAECMSVLVDAFLCICEEKKRVVRVSFEIEWRWKVCDDDNDWKCDNFDSDAVVFRNIFVNKRETKKRNKEDTEN